MRLVQSHYVMVTYSNNIQPECFLKSSKSFNEKPAQVQATGSTKSQRGHANDSKTHDENELYQLHVFAPDF
jgi:hypothetical protein